MSSGDWDEVKRLAADFQKAQLSSTLLKLSERNCVEIITKLIESNLLNVVFTADGKEYITPQHLEKEIRDELYISGGRIDLVKLTKILNVDFTQVSKIANEIEKHDKGVKIILGQLIDRSYMTKIVTQINDKLVQAGHINIAELTIHYDLPAEFLQSLVEKSLGKSIHGQQDKQDPKFFYTDNFIARNKCKVRGALIAITRPTPLTAILGQCAVPERIFFTIFDDLHNAGETPGVLTSKQINSGLYVPTIYTKTQSEWVDNFYKQNGYLEYDALTRLGINDGKSYIKRHFSQNTPILLESVAVGPAIIDQIDANIEEVIATNSFVDIYPLLPSVFTPEDIEILLKDALKRLKKNFHIFITTVIASEAFMNDLNNKLESIAELKAKEAVDSGKWLQHVAESKIKTSKNIESHKFEGNSKKDDRRKKAASGKAGGGSQGRETKTKSTKKKYYQGKNNDNDYDDDDDNRGSKGSDKFELILFSVDDLKSELNRYENLSDVEELVDELTNYFHPKLNKLALTLAEKFAQATKTTNFSDVEDKLNMLITNIRVFDKGIKCIGSKDTVNSLTKYLIKTLGTDFINELLKLAAVQNVLQCSDNLTTESRQKMIVELPDDIRDELDNVNKAVIKGSIEELLNSAEPAMAACCLILKKFDKKREKAVILGHRQALLEELKDTEDPALALHLTTSILFTAATQCALHMSGRHVSSILSFLQSFLIPTTSTLLTDYHDHVLELLSSNDSTTKEETRKLLTDGLEKLKDIAYSFKEQIKNSDNKNE
ncbi:E3 UFM1-protein ligase 1 homolog [Microplitis mediator]|uniref:E3 UFM1-protein ligase 1 homolog n=1 Tax=Microplitis mediator TaxID=375433 RepID=UPI0025530321|nr:E3 UFM1-protein ligase 1 homolog [Microplitis mediator]XP_057324397.1 E3 UFM1-protein ligase 1 homolog [Microplitis mediator]XP_057324398.1 E3 UFM1-protein ligase 1 homolog [Microplitis mediator]